MYSKNKYRTPKLKDGASFIFNCTKALQVLKTKKGDSREKVSHLVPEAGIEPALPKELDFESSASTSSATRATAVLGCKYKTLFAFYTIIIGVIHIKTKL